METVRTIAALHGALEPWRAAGERIAFVPTMGNLHAGHLALVEEARRVAERSVVSIFVNPLQFDRRDDFQAYPRTLEADRRALEGAGADLLFLPEVEEMYPRGMEGCTRVEVPGLSDVLCGAFRPGHFVGVATVVTKLLNAVRPDVALFGEKDYQQLLVVRRLVEDLNLPVEVRGVPTVREADGLALSSRNRYLSPEERARAPALYRALCAARDRLQAGEGPAAVEAAGMAELAAAGLRPEYFAVRRREDLEEPGPLDDRLVVLAAAWLGRARLIDNLFVDL
ncbi:MAG: pantoate--beta-alanine ligase [Gammaproteobacteria bacterium]|nr:MAG: pantoate--beta-alanine ligase [Gammaproteobacteria bacterium]